MDIIAIGKTTSHASGIKFGIKRADRRQHVYIVGQTGTGKSTLIKNMAIQDMREGHGVALLTRTANSLRIFLISSRVRARMKSYISIRRTSKIPSA